MNIAEMHDIIITCIITSATAHNNGGLDLKKDENYMYVFDLQLPIGDLSCLVVI